tara:strand:- start:44 stop:511 length:468 start_codon:yes stop_codon:yes gene_type:complete
MKSEVAKCAAEIRKILKEKNIKASVRSQQYSMGNNVNVEIKEILDPEIYKALQAELAKYQYGHFNGMEDIYEYSNNVEGIPQTKFLFVKYDWRMQDAALEQIEEFLKDKVDYNNDNCPNPDYEYKRLAGDILMGRHEFDAWIEWEEVKNIIKVAA